LKSKVASLKVLTFMALTLNSVPKQNTLSKEVDGSWSLRLRMEQLCKIS